MDTKSSNILEVLFSFKKQEFIVCPALGNVRQEEMTSNSNELLQFLFARLMCLV